jgi:hypothetical protein
MDGFIIQVVDGVGLKVHILDREDEVVSDTALLPRVWGGLSVVSGLGPGLTR